jgi:hypothetical protein
MVLLLCVHAGVGHCMFQKYVAIAAVWVVVPPIGAACMPPAGADSALCACGRVKVEHAQWSRGVGEKRFSHTRG